MNTIRFDTNQMLRNNIRIVPIWYYFNIAKIDKDNFNGKTETWNFTLHLGAVIEIVFVELGDYRVADFGFRFELGVPKKEL